MTWPSSYDNVPTVNSGDLITATQENLEVNILNAIETTMGLNPQGSYATVGDAVAGKIDTSGGTMSGTLSMGSNRITNVATPTSSSDAATKAYVDGMAGGGLQVLPSVRVASTGNVNISTGGLISVDGVTVSAGDRVLLKNQTNAVENGLYTAATGAWSRTSDTLVNDVYTLVTQGSTQAGQGYVLTTPNPITVGTTPLTFTQFNLPGTGGAASGVNHDITAMTALTGPLQAPTAINDTSGNAVVKFTGATAAVNSVTATNAASGGTPSLSGGGGDTNVGLALNTQGTGPVALNASTVVTANGGTGLVVHGGPLAPVSPSSISGLVLWLKADAITGVSSGSTLTMWPDASSLGNNATASTTAPTYFTEVLNGLPIVRFDGTDDTMTLGSLITNAQTVFWVCRENIAAAAYRPFLGSTSYTDFYRGPSDAFWNSAYDSSGVVNGVTRLNGSLVSTPTTTAPPQGQFMVVSLVGTGPSHVNQITQDRNVSGNVWNGDIAEIIIYNTALSDTDRIHVEEYLSNKYNIPISAPSPTGAPLLDLRDANNNSVAVVNFGGGVQVKMTTVQIGSSYAASVGDYVILVNKVTGSATTISLPSSPAAGQLMTIKDAKGDAATNAITISPTGGTIDGASSATISTNYGVLRLIYNGSQWNTL